MGGNAPYRLKMHTEIALMLHCAMASKRPCPIKAENDTSWES
jgi:hypothetical protein